MKILTSMLSAAIGALLLCQSLAAQTPMGTAITYAQTNVKKGAVLVNDTWDVAFKLFTAASGGTQVGPVIFKNNVVFTSGTMPTQSLNFGPDAFNGEARFLEIKVRQGTDTFAAAGARRRLDAVPYALALPGLRTEQTEGTPNVIGGSKSNVVADGIEGATIAGGGGPGGGMPASENQVMGYYGTVGGGWGNLAGSEYSTVGGGQMNTASADASTVGGGLSNEATHSAATVSGGGHNAAGGIFSTVAGGGSNQANGYASSVFGGYQNIASGDYSLAAGRRGRAIHAGAFVWADSYNGNFNSFATNSFNARATGGFFFYTNAAQTSGAIMSPGDGSWTNLSDRNHKRDITPVNAREVLSKVVNMPVATWNYDSQEPSIRHMGPMAQDFHAAFGLGTRETHITTIDADGVALAAIQGMSQVMDEVVREKDAEIASLKELLASLEETVERLSVAVAVRSGD